MKIKIALILLVSIAGLHAAPMDEIQINGYTSFEYEKNLDGDGGDKYGSFDADLFDLVLNLQVTPNLRVATDITWEHGAASEDGRGNVAMEYGFPEYTIYPWLKVRAGKMFTYFGIYNEIHTAKPTTLTVKEPLSTNKNDKIGSDIRFYPRWSTGIAILGDIPMEDDEAEYIIQISNGEQEETNPYEEDNNSFKALSASANYTFDEVVKVGSSVYWDRISDEAEVLSVGIQAEYMAESFLVELEIVAGYVGTYDKTYRYGYTALVGYTFYEFLTPYFRYEMYDPDEDAPKDLSFLFVYGINLMIDEGFYLKTELNTFNSQHKALVENGYYTELKAALVLGF